jgi:hypothetical protein
LEKESIRKFFIGFFVMTAILLILVSFSSIIVTKNGSGLFTPSIDFLIFVMYLYFCIQMYCFLPEKPKDNSSYYSHMMLIFFFATLGSFSVLISNFVI